MATYTTCIIGCLDVLKLVEKIILCLISLHKKHWNCKETLNINCQRVYLRFSKNLVEKKNAQEILEKSPARKKNLNCFDTTVYTILFLLVIRYIKYLR